MQAPNNDTKLASFRIPHRSSEQLKRLTEDRHCTKTAVLIQLLERADYDLELKQQAKTEAV